MLNLVPLFTAYILFLTALLGLVMGSFLNCTAWRLVHHEPIARGRSHCVSCGHVLGPLDLIPLFSWVFLRGRCRYCGERISPRYPLTELFCAVIYVSVVLRYQLTWDTLRFLWLLSLLFVAALVDLEDGWIPDRLLVLGAVGYVPTALLSGGWQLLVRGLFGAVVLFVPLLLLVLLMDRIMGAETMGGGDLKLIALLGLYFGWDQGLLLILVSCVFGLLLAAAAGKLKTRTKTPFGPSLALAAWVTALFGGPVIGWYRGFFGI